jgi:phosphatidyl-myo-inositol alpha-mannosyltransferase
MRAFSLLADRYPDLQFVVVGDGPERHAIDEVPAALRGRVHMKGKVSYEALPTYHRAADIFISPATGAESFGIVLVEAMAAGLPVVASNIPGYREVARDGRESLLVTPSDPSALAQGIAQLLDHPEERVRLGANGAARAEAYAWEHIIDELELVYESLSGITRREPAMA